MKQAIEKRVRALESRAAPWRPKKITSRMETARLVAFALAEGAEAKRELEAGAALDAARHAELEQQLAAARSIAAALEAGPSRRETPLSARTIIPGSLDALLAAVI